MTFMPDKKPSSNPSELLIFRSSDLHASFAGGQRAGSDEPQRFDVR
jgi:hypothetical protein